MYQGAHLTLLIGKGIPVPPPREVTEAVREVQVTNSKDRSGFQISFRVGKSSPLSQSLLPGGFFEPIVTRVVIVATLRGIPHVLMDGLVTNVEYQPGDEPGTSTLSVTGEDLSLAMDLVELTIPYPGMDTTAIVYSILARYVPLGVAPVVIPPFIPDFKNPVRGFATQRGTDRGYLRLLARRAGFVFFIQPGPLPGQSVAYFGPDVNLPVPQAAVSVDFDAHTNARGMSFSLDGMAKRIKVYTIFDPVTKKVPIPIPVPNVNLFKPPLGARPTPPARVTFADDAAPMSPAEAAQSILGFLMGGANAASVRASGTLNVAEYGHILRARMLVGVRGASIAYDGYYYVDSVTHSIKKGSYEQRFSLSRDGLISSVPNVNV